jgi:UDP-N-acetylglucosamine 2-epimerase (non-hydrolysing)
MIVVIWGSRPEAIKIGACVAALKADRTPHICLSTGQHTTLLVGTPAETDLADSISLGLRATGEVVRWGDMALPIIQAALTQHKASLVVVQGDTLSAVVGARAGDALGLPVAHIEAGIRSHDLCSTLARGAVPASKSRSSPRGTIPPRCVPTTISSPKGSTQSKSF